MQAGPFTGRCATFSYTELVLNKPIMLLILSWFRSVGPCDHRKIQPNQRGVEQRPNRSRVSRMALMRHLAPAGAGTAIAATSKNIRPTLEAP